MSLYLETQTVWQTATEDSATMQVAAILVPNELKSIDRWEQYLELLVERVDWLIRQEESQEAAWNLMRDAVRRAQLDGIQLPQTAELEPDELPGSIAWAWAMTRFNFKFQEMLGLTKPLDAKGYLFEFPQPTTSTPEQVAAVEDVIQTTTLSDWLEVMIDLSRPD